MDWSHLESWLSSLYNGRPLPDFERTNKSYELLNTLRNFNFNSIDLVEHVLDSKVEIHLSDDSQKAIDSLALLADVLGMDTTELGNYYTAVSKLAMDRMELQHENIQLDEVKYMLNSSQKKATEDLSLMKSILLKLQQEAVQHQTSDSIDSQSLSSSYSYLQNEYNALGIQENDMSLHSIHQLENKVISMEDTIEEQNKILETYKTLPSDMMLASTKIKKTEDYLHHLEQEREDLISEIANSVH